MAKGWDLTSTNSLQGAAVWLLKLSGALCVCVIRVDDLAVAGDPELAPRDVMALLEDRAEELHQTLEAERKALRARLDRQAVRGKR